jgi:tRNA threonylcarbamoyladenosine biosynthesis protein TsaE
MVTLTSRSPDDTVAVGAAWGRDAAAGWVIGLNGELGAGKTQLVRGLALGLGCAARVHSPTFALVNEYRGGRLPLFHLDLYRLETPEQVRAAGLEEYLFRTEGVTVIEWFARGEFRPLKNDGGDSNPAARCRWRQVWIEIVNESERRIAYEDCGG